jgi:tetratricopeptide (TPR) repeat protein
VKHLFSTNGFLFFQLTRVFNWTFNSLTEASRKLLIQLSAFDAPFDVIGAMKVTGAGPSLLDMSGAMDILIKRHLLEIEDISDAISEKSGKISVYANLEEHRNIRVSLHTLTHNFIDELCSENLQYDNIRQEAEKSKQMYFRDLIYKLGRDAVKDSLKASMTLSEYRGSFKVCVDETINDDTVQPSFDDRVNFKKQFHSHVVMEWFLNPKKRAEYYFKKAQLAEMKGDVLSFVGMETWYADTFFDGPYFDPKVIKAVLKEIKTALGKLANGPREKAEGVALVRAHYFYVQARYHFRENESDDAIEISRNCVKIFKNILGCDLATARALNLAGSAYHLKGNLPKESLKYHMKSCFVLEKLAETYHADIHFDSVMYYQNVGSQYHCLGNKIADELDMNIMSCTRREKLNKKKLEHYGKAIMQYGKSIEVTNQLHMNGTWNHALILRNRCTLLIEIGEIKKALQSAEEANHIAEVFLSKDTFLQIKSNSVLGTAHCDMAEDVFGKGKIGK